MSDKKATFANLQVLKETQDTVRAQLGEKYNEVVAPFISIIQMVMKANNENEFEAMKRIKEGTDLYKRVDAPPLFASALMEITQNKHFVGFDDQVKVNL